jgi:nitrite reductase/ring-hydroxylating ferredoxin subunit
MAWTILCPFSDLLEGKARYVETSGLQLAVFLHQGQPHVIDNYCPHAGGSLSAGYVEDGCAVCPWHNWPFRLNTGELKGSSAVRIAVYKSRVSNAGGEQMVEAELP